MNFFATFDIQCVVVWPSLWIGKVGECECGSCGTPVYGATLSWACWSVGLALN